MKKFSIILSAAAVLLCLSACEKKELSGSKAGLLPESQLIKVTLSTGHATKTSLGTDGSVLWSEGDAIAVAAATSGNVYEFTLTSGAGTASASFEGLVRPADVEDLAYASYPYADNLVVDGGAITGFAVPATQTYVANTFADNTNPMTGVISGNAITFTNVAALAKITLYSGLPVQKAQLGDYTMEFDNLDATAGVDLIFVVEAADYSSDVEFKVNDVTVSAFSGKAAVAGKRFDFGTYNTNVCKIGDAIYHTLEEAIAAVGDAETVTLVCDIPDAFGMSVPSGKNFTIDFAGHTLTFDGPGAGSAGTKTQGFQLLKDSNVTFKNGTIGCSEANAAATWTSSSTEKGIAMLIQNYANLTLEDMEIDGTNIAHNGAAVRYVLSNNSGNVNYTGSTSIIAKEGDITFDVCKNSSYPAPVVTWNSTGSLVGAVELTGGEFVIAEDLALSDHISVEAAAALTVNAEVTPASGYGKDYLVGIKRGGKLTVDGTGSVDAGSVYSVFKMTLKGEVASGSEAELIVNGGTFTGYYYSISGNGGRHDTKVTVNDGTFNAPNGFCIYNPQDGDVTVNGGIFNGYTCIGVKGGNFVIAGGEFNASGAKVEYSGNGSGMQETGACVIVDNCGYPGGAPVVEITGGTFKSANNDAIQSFASKSGYSPVAAFVSGGSYSDNNVASLCIPGCSVDANASTGLWDVIVLSESVLSGTTTPFGDWE